MQIHGGGFSDSWSQIGDQERKKGEVVISSMNVFTVRL